MTDATVVALLCAASIALAAIASAYAVRANARSRRIERQIDRAMVRNAARRAHDEHLAPPGNGARR